MSDLALQLIAENKRTHAPLLDLGNCGLTELPDELFKLTWLESLNVGRWYLEGEKWRETANKANSNQIQEQALTHLQRLPALVKLYLSSNDLTDISVLAQLPQLQTLDLGSNNITDIGVLAQLPQLQTLHLSSNDLTEISVLAQLPQLQTLYSSSNNLTDISVLAQLPQLQTLYLGSNNLTDISVLTQLPQLQTLDLSSNNLTDISVLTQLPQLQTLDLSFNKLTDIGVVAQLPQLQTLDLSFNKLTDIGVLAQLPQLQTLHLSSNDLTDIGVLAQLSQLLRLHLSSNNLTDISVLAQLPQLQTLDLSSNDLTDIGVLAQLPQLQMLDLNKTSVTNLLPLQPLIKQGLPVKWSVGFWRGPGIYVEDCHLINPPVDIVKQGNGAILNYFRQVDEQGETVPLYEARTIMVGEPGAGKTSLTEKLLDETHEVIPNDAKKEPTHGINVRENWEFSDGERPGETFTSHIWDFGGQEIQYMTHQFFLTPESLYVLVADDRKQHTLFPYWFEVIQLLGKDELGRQSPVLVVLNERNHKSISNFDLVAYRDKYPDLRIEMLEVDLSEGKLNRFRAVRDKIQQLLCTLDHVGRPLPRMWAPIRQAILDRSKQQNHLTEAEFADICAQHNVTRPDDRALISTYLHRLGAILHFQEDMQLRDFLIINPSWALKAVYAVLEDKAVAERHGQFSEADLDRYWYELTNGERAKILSLMKRDNFEICYPVGSRAYIAPQLLPQVRPVFKWESRGSLKCQFFYRFMPKGIMTRLIVRKHESLTTDGRVWARGAVFEYAECEILITEEETERNGLIAIEVNGTTHLNRIRALNFVRDEIEAIHAKWFHNIEYEERAPCNCTDCEQSPTPTFFSWKKLSQRVNENRTTIECDHNTVKDVPVMSLLEGVYDQERIKSLLAERRRGSWQYVDTSRIRLDRDKTKQLTLATLTLASETSPISEPPMLPTPVKSTNWLPIALVAALVAAVFFAFSKPGSKLDFLGWFKAEQGAETKASKTAVAETVAATVTVIGTIKINNRNVRPDQVNSVYVKGETAGARATIDMNGFRLREVRVPKDRLITIAIDLPSGQFASQLFKIPELDPNGVADLGEVLLTVDYPKPSRKTSSGKVTGSPTIIITNQNIQKN